MKKYKDFSSSLYNWENLNFIWTLVHFNLKLSFCQQLIFPAHWIFWVKCCRQLQKFKSYLPHKRILNAIWIKLIKVFNDRKKIKHDMKCNDMPCNDMPCNDMTCKVMTCKAMHVIALLVIALHVIVIVCHWIVCHCIACHCIWLSQVMNLIQHLRNVSESRC